MCKSRCEMFRGRETVVNTIKGYLTSQWPPVGSEPAQRMSIAPLSPTPPAREPMVVYGESGSGKTSILAKAASMVQTWMGSEKVKPVMVLRFLGKCQVKPHHKPMIPIQGLPQSSPLLQYCLDYYYLSEVSPSCNTVDHQSN